MANSETQPGRTPHRRDLEKRTVEALRDKLVIKDPVAYHEALLLEYLLKDPSKVKKWADQGQTAD